MIKTHCSSCARKNISFCSRHCFALSARCFFSNFIFILFSFFVVAVMVVLSRGLAPSWRDEKDAEIILACTAEKGTRAKRGKFVGWRPRVPRAWTTGRRNGGRIICWTPGRERLIATLCLRDTREFCNWMIEVARNDRLRRAAFCQGPRLIATNNCVSYRLHKEGR